MKGARSPAASPRMRWIRFTIAAFVLHLSWEMAHMRLYTGIGDRPWLSTIPACSRAALFDVVLTFAAAVPFLLIARHRRSLAWPWAATAMAGAILAVVVEAVGRGGGRWSYTSGMPTLPGSRLGVLPILQMSLIPAVCAWIAFRRSGHLRPGPR